MTASHRVCLVFPIVFGACWVGCSRPNQDVRSTTEPASKGVPAVPPVPTSQTDKLLAEMREGGRYPQVDAIVVLQDGEIVLEEYFGSWTRDKLHDSRSSFKSVTALLAGIAVDRGVVDLDRPVALYLDPSLSEELPADSPKRRITVRHLLSMTSGIDCEEFYDRGPNCENEMWRTEDWVRFSWHRPMRHEPGEVWAYNSEEPMLVGAVVAQATGQSVPEFADETLFAPLGISSYRWTKDPSGNAMTGGSFFMRPLDMVRLGELVLNGGRWNGRQVVSESWLEEMTRGRTELDPDEFFSFTRLAGRDPQSGATTDRNVWPGQTPTRYGYYWYREALRFGAGWESSAEVVFASGNGGQYIMVFPELHAVVVFTGSNYDNWRGKWPFDILVHYLLPDLADLARKTGPRGPG